MLQMRKQSQIDNNQKVKLSQDSKLLPVIIARDSI